MFFKELIDQKRYCFHEQFETWEDAVRASCQPLIEDGSIDSRYTQSVIDCVHKYGPYIVFTPDIAMPHSQEGAVGVNSTAVSFMKVEKPVSFEEGNPDKDARLFFVLASKDHEEHIKNMEQLAEMLLTEGIVEELLKVKEEDGLLRVDELVEKAKN